MSTMYQPTIQYTDICVGGVSEPKKKQKKGMRARFEMLQLTDVERKKISGDDSDDDDYSHQKYVDYMKKNCKK